MSADTPSPRDTLLQMIGGFRLTQAISVAATLGIADLLADGPRTVHDLAEATDAHAPSLHRLLRALASTGIFVEVDGRFAETPRSRYLRSDLPGSLRAWAMNVGQDYSWNSWGHFLDCIKSGEPAFPTLYGTSVWEYRAERPEQNDIFNAGMTGLWADVPDAIAHGYDFSGIGTLVDVGGGEGSLLATILAANPALRGILYDQAHVVSGAATILEGADVADRCEVIAGSFFESVPAGGDAYLLKSIIHDWDDAPAIEILRRCRHAIVDGGRLLVVEAVIAPPNVPDPAKFLDLTMMVMLGGRERTAEDVGRLYAEAGFELTRLIETSSAFGIFEGVPV